MFQLIVIILAITSTTGFLQPPNTTQAPCVDVAPNCAQFNICASDFHTAKTLCRKFCNLCDVVDGLWTIWGSWGTCSVTCGDGTRARTRTCDDPKPSHGGDNQGPQLETSTCLMNQCPVHGGWGGWSTWGTCSSTCGIGLRRRDRACDSPWPSKDGNHCFGDSVDQDICMEFQCAIGWTSWTGWSACTATCGTGTQSRTRACQNPLASALNSSCPGDCTDFRSCTDRSCTSIFTATGRVTIPGTAKIRFPTVQLNEGGDYNASTGVFTCRIPGQYWFSSTITKISSDNIGYVSCVVLNNGNHKLGMYTDPVTDETAAHSMSTSAGFHLRLGDRVQVGDCRNPDHIYNDADTVFSGILIKPDV